MTSEDVRALLDEQIKFPDSPIRLHRHGGYVQAMSAYEIALADALEASAVSTPPTITDERIAAVEAVHPKHFASPHNGVGFGMRVQGTENLTGQERYVCGSCKRPWPCPTIAALHPGGETNG